MLASPPIVVIAGLVRYLDVSVLLKTRCTVFWKWHWGYTCRFAGRLHPDSTDIWFASILAVCWSSVFASILGKVIFLRGCLERCLFYIFSWYCCFEAYLMLPSVRWCSYLSPSPSNLVSTSMLDLWLFLEEKKKKKLILVFFGNEFAKATCLQ